MVDFQYILNIVLVGFLISFRKSTSALKTHQGVQSAAERSLHAFDNERYPLSDRTPTSEEAPAGDNVGSSETSADRPSRTELGSPQFGHTARAFKQHQTLPIEKSVNLRPPSELDMSAASSGIQNDRPVPVWPGSAQTLAFRRLSPISEGLKYGEYSQKPHNSDVYDFRPQNPATASTTSPTNVSEISRKVIYLPPCYVTCR